MEELNLIQKVAIWALPVLFAITAHEVAHGWVALRFGDRTAMMLGRLTLNPIKHIDPIGTLLVPGLLLMLGGFLFGWAKPVPVTVQNLRHPKRDMAWVALAGPAANLLMAIIWVLFIKVGLMIGTALPWLAKPLIYMGGAGVSINVVLMALNLLPLPPLDGGRIMASLLPGPWAWRFERLEPFGFLILLGLIITGILGKILGPIVGTFERLLYLLAGV
ncbi:MAG: site-2 protease family protein [Gammaproteobacteria bacterium]|nr:site-2 protease family protein [Gammaproteobacteria bacterium]